ncbi:MAG: Ig-like domain-containing protein, partial [Gemmatimonadota bacterium]
MTVIVFGLNQTPISHMALVHVPLTIAAGTPAGTLSLPISAVVYSDPAGLPIAAGPNTNGTITVTAPPVQTPVLTSISITPSAASISSSGTQQFTATAKDQFGATMSGITLNWGSSNASAATISAAGLATGKNTGTTALTSNITASASGVTSNAALLTVNGTGMVDTTAPIIFNLRAIRTRVWATSATVSWETDEPADSQVAFGLTKTLGGLSPLNASLATDHSVVLTGLGPWSRYHV